MARRDERLLACEILAQLLTHNGSLASHLHPGLRQQEGLNYALLQEYCYGLCRWYLTLDFWAGRLLDKPLRRKDRDVYCLILLGLYQLFFMRTPAHAVVHSTVEATEALGKHWAKGLVNALLREAQRRETELREAADADFVLKYAHPDWLLAAFKRDWPGRYRELLDANNQRAPMTLRVHRSRSTREDYRARLLAAGLASEPGSLTHTALHLRAPVDVHALPGFASGDVSVQDEASQLLPLLLPFGPGQRILDACAAPGGKTCALLECEPTLQVLCLDNESKRLPRLRDNLARCGLQATVLAGDITLGVADAAPASFDSVLLDAPCSATGVIRRHPDIKLLRTPDEVQALVQKQRALLDAAWPLLITGGHLLYSTCSVLRDENDRQIARFLEQHSDAREVPLAQTAGVPCAHGLQLFPQAGGHDGFYYALLRKW